MTDTHGSPSSGDHPVTPRPVGPVPGQRSTKVGVWIGLAALVALAVFPYSASGLLAPLWGIVVLYVGLAALIVASWRSRYDRPVVAYLAPLLAVAWWWGFITFGEQVLGWTA